MFAIVNFRAIFCTACVRMFRNYHCNSFHMPGSSGSLFICHHTENYWTIKHGCHVVFLHSTQNSLSGSPSLHSENTLLPCPFKVKMDKWVPLLSEFTFTAIIVILNSRSEDNAWQNPHHNFRERWNSTRDFPWFPTSRFMCLTSWMLRLVGSLSTCYVIWMKWESLCS